MNQLSSETASLRIGASGLGEPGRSVLGVVQHIGAVQAQQLFGAQMAVLNRSAQEIGEIDHLLECGDLLISWLNRGTLHLVAREDFWNYQELTAPGRKKTLATRFKSFGITNEHQDRVLARLSQTLGYSALTKEELVPLMELDKVPVATKMAGIVAASFLELASAHGLLVRGPRAGVEPTYISAHHWVGPRPATAGDLAASAERYSLSHHTSTAEDFAGWLGIGIREARAVWRACTDDQEPVTWTGLLGPFDPLLHGWKDRAWLLGDHVSDIISTNGIFRPSIIVENICVGSWKYIAGEIQLEYFETVSSSRFDEITETAGLLAQQLSK